MNRLALLTILIWIIPTMACHDATGPDNLPEFHVTLDCPVSTLRISDSTAISASEDMEDSILFTWEWHVNIGQIEGSGSQIVYVAPETSGTALITVRLHNAEMGTAEDSISITVYRQFIMLKADDFTAEATGSISTGWERFVTAIMAKDLKAGLGLIGNSLENAGPAYIIRILELVQSGRFELWNHGYDHAMSDSLCEFQHTSYEYQTNHLLKTQHLAEGKLGITLHTFGAPGNKFDQNTTKVIDDAHDIRVWLFGDSASGKLVLGRYAEIEFPTHHPDYEKFLQGYDSEREYLVFQIHPRSWDDAAFEEFEKILDYLTAADATFVTPYEYYLLHNP